MNVEFEDTQLDNIIQLRKVSHSYDEGKSFVIKDLDFLVENKPGQGQFIVILGPSGCGKSTVLRYIAGIQKPSSGDILIHDMPMTEKTNISMVFQKYSSLPWLSVEKNVALGLKFKGVEKHVRIEKALEMIDLVGLSGHEKKYAQYPNLSGGQLQRVAIARSLLANPDILLMDEPFGALDIRTRLDMQDMLARIWTRFQITVVFVTHDISEAVYLGDEIHIMSSQPAQIVERITVDLPMERKRHMKRDKSFVNMVYDIEDKMMALQD